MFFVLYWTKKFLKFNSENVCESKNEYQNHCERQVESLRKPEIISSRVYRVVEWVQHIAFNYKLFKSISKETNFLIVKDCFKILFEIKMRFQSFEVCYI